MLECSVPGLCRCRPSRTFSIELRGLPVRPSVSTVAVLMLLAGSFYGSGCSRSPDAPSAPTTLARSAALAPDELRRELDEVLDFTFERKLDAHVNAAWQIVHGIMAFGPAYEVRVDGQVRPALDWLLEGGALRGWTLER